MIDFCLSCQKIENTNDVNDRVYELLLRTTKGTGFPANEFSKIITNTIKHKEYVSWITQGVESILDKNHGVKISLNLDHQELEYSETFNMLQNLVRYKERIIIEITEAIPFSRSTTYFTNINVAAFKKIKKLGYEIALDDTCEGMNSLGNLLHVLDMVDIVKISILELKRNIEETQLKNLLLCLADIFIAAGKKIIIEGIEDAPFSNWIRDNITELQQGYLFSKPFLIWPLE